MQRSCKVMARSPNLASLQMQVPDWRTTAPEERRPVALLQHRRSSAKGAEADECGSVQEQVLRLPFAALGAGPQTGEPPGSPESTSWRELGARRERRCARPPRRKERQRRFQAAHPEYACGA